MVHAHISQWGVSMTNLWLILAEVKGCQDWIMREWGINISRIVCSTCVNRGFWFPLIWFLLVLKNDWFLVHLHLRSGLEHMFTYGWVIASKRCVCVCLVCYACVCCACVVCCVCLCVCVRVRVHVRVRARVVCCVCVCMWSNSSFWTVIQISWSTRNGSAT